MSAVVYGIRAKGDTQYFYIGCTTKGADARLKGHVAAIRQGVNGNHQFANKVKKIGYSNLVIDTLEKCEPGQRFVREEWWIKHLLSKGVRLTNLVHNGMLAHAGSRYSLRGNWEWAKGWYADYLAGYRWSLGVPELEDGFLAAQARLAATIRGILAAPEPEQADLLAQIEHL